MCNKLLKIKRLIPCNTTIIALMNSMIDLEYYGVSPYELEAIYNTLSKFSGVCEKKLEDSEYLSLLNIEFPVPYDDYFFQSFGFDNWQKIKYIFKEMKRRRGRKDFKIILSFSGISISEICGAVLPMRARLSTLPRTRSPTSRCVPKQDNRKKSAASGQGHQPKEDT